MIKYKGIKAFIQGIPARDLTDVEWNALSKEQQKAAIESGLYELPAKQKTAKEGE